MFRKKINDKELDMKNVNDVVLLLKKILKISYFLIIIAAVVGVTLISKEWNVKSFVFSILKVVSPLFIGLIIAWLFNPFVTWLKKKGIRRSFGTGITYILLLGIMFFLFSSIIPLLIDQINEFVKAIPDVINTVNGWLNEFFGKFDSIDYVNADVVKTQLVDSLKAFGTNMTEKLPTMTFDILKSIFSGLGVILIGLIIGFYLLLTFDGVGNTLIGFLPKRFQKNTKELTSLVNDSMIRYVQGACLDSTVVFFVTSFGLWLVGLKAPLLFGLFCGITNVIPYAGPYIGGFPAVIVGFAQGPTTGILVLLVIVVIQFVEGNFFQPYIMSKTTKLHPVTIILGLLVFGHFWGILGMVVSTPIIGSIKAVILYFDSKYEVFGFNENIDKRKVRKEIDIES